MTNNKSTQTLSAADKLTLRTAAHGAVALMSYAGVAGSPHRIATNGSLALSSATGLVGHVLAPKPKDVKLDYRSAATVADQVLPALAASVKLLKAQAPGEADNFRNTVLVAVQAAAQAGKGEPTAPVVDMVRKITAALES